MLLKDLIDDINKLSDEIKELEVKISKCKCIENKIPQYRRYYISPDLNIYDGAGIMLVETKYNNNKGRNEAAIILFCDQNKSIYEDAGGGYEIKDETIEHTAQREGLEETLGMICVTDLDIIKNYSIDLHRKNNPSYKCCFIGLESGQFNKKDFIENKYRLNNVRKLPIEWSETGDMARFYINDLNNIKKNPKDHSWYGKNTYIWADVDGNTKIISARGVGLVKTANDQGIITNLINNPHTTTKGTLNKFEQTLNTLNIT